MLPRPAQLSVPKATESWAGPGYYATCVASLVPRPLPDFISQPWAWGGGYCVARCSRVSELKYESVRIDFKAVVSIRANPGKKETTDGSGSHVNFIQKQCTFPKW